MHSYIFEVVQIIEGGIEGNKNKLKAYAEQLTRRLEADGEADLARQISQALQLTPDKNMATMAHLGATSLIPGSLSAQTHLSSTEDFDFASLPLDAEFQLPMVEVTWPQTEKSQVVLTEESKSVIEHLVSSHRAAARLRAVQLDTTLSLLLHGPPGCGKTTTATYIAAQLGLPLVTARADAIISSYLGHTSKNLRQLFDYAASVPCVLFLDELDALGKMRDDAHEIGELKRVVISLLQNIDVLNARRGTEGQGRRSVLVAATNHEHLLDPALWRRFTFKARLDAPPIEPRQEMLEQFLRGWAGSDLIFLLASLTEGLCGAALKNIADECIRTAILQGQFSIDQSTALRIVFSVAAEYRRTEQTPAKTVTASKSSKEALQELLWVDQKQLGDRGSDSFAKLLQILKKRDPKSWTQNRLAETFGVSQAQISRLLRDGERKIALPE